MAWICFPFTAKSFPCHKITSESQGKMRSSGKTLVGKQWREVLVTAGVRESPPPRALPRGPHLLWDPISAGTPTSEPPRCSPAPCGTGKRRQRSQAFVFPLSFPRLNLEHPSFSHPWCFNLLLPSSAGSRDGDEVGLGVRSSISQHALLFPPFLSRP